MRRFIHSLFHLGILQARLSRSPALLEPVGEDSRWKSDTPEHFSACQFTPARCLCLAAITGADAQYWPRCNRRRPATEQQRLQRGTPSLARLAPPTSSASLPRATSSGASCRRRLSPRLPRERTHVGVCLSTRESNTYVRVCLRVHVYLCNISLS